MWGQFLKRQVVDVYQPKLVRRTKAENMVLKSFQSNRMSVPVMALESVEVKDKGSDQSNQSLPATNVLATNPTTEELLASNMSARKKGKHSSVQDF
jgi:hypothetical protein